MSNLWIFTFYYLFTTYKVDAERAVFNPFYKDLYNKSYFEAARRARNRSLLGVNEDFELKADVERALLERNPLYNSKSTTIGLWSDGFQN